MVNHFAIGAHPHRHGYLGWYRRVHRSINEILKDDAGKEIIFPSRADAKAAAADELCRYLNGSIVASGFMPANGRAEAEAVFRRAAE